MEPREAKVEILAHGPYEVTGDVALRPRRVVRTAAGEALTYRAEGELAHEETYYLCRCGRSEHKPFCDGSHAFELFDGTETAATNTYDERAERHEGPGVVVRVDHELCHHAAFCNYEANSYFDLIGRADSTNTLSQLIAMIDRCPSGALAIEVDGQDVEAALPVQISPIGDGPLLLTGGVRVTRADGVEIEVRNRLSLCRCGGSENKPLCDGSHRDIGFEA
jgi:CDGSH-type Zn-finger protein/ferredoxin